MKNSLFILFLSLFSTLVLATTPYGGVIHNIRSEQPVGLLAQILEQTDDFSDTYLYLHCSKLCETYEIVVAEDLGGKGRYMIFHPLTGKSRSQTAL